MYVSIHIFFKWIFWVPVLCLTPCSGSFWIGDLFFISFTVLCWRRTDYLTLLLLLLSRFSRAQLTLCNPIDCSPPGSAVPGILQASTLEGVAISFSIAWEWKVKVKPLSRVRLIATPWTAAYQAPPSMGFSRQEYWSGVPLPAFSVSHPKICHFGMRSWRQWRPSKPRKNFVSRP